MNNRFYNLFRELSARIQNDYVEARVHARASDPQRAGHEGEATWESFLRDWGPGWPVVSRKYIVGPGGDSNEVDLVILKPDYPQHLMDSASILASGVAAAFSVKLTLRREHLREAIEQKRRLLSVSGTPHGVKEILSGPFPFVLLSHSTELYKNSEDFHDSMVENYEVVAHRQQPQLVKSPSEELDGLLIADRGFFRTIRSTLAPDTRNLRLPWIPLSSFSRYSEEDLPEGAPIAQFVTWLNGQFSTQNNYALKTLEEFFGNHSTVGYMTRWPLSIYPENIREHRHLLRNQFGNPLVF